jgi:Ser/Thr protein kinase RdoA (MazF antagonist)
MEEKQIHFNDIARQAVAEYDVQDYTLIFIRHSDNVTFKVESPGLDAYLLRIHIPVTRAMGTHGADARAVNSELLWLEALSQDTDLVLQKPVRNRAGTLVTQVFAENAALPVNCTLMHWVDGQSYHRDLESEQTAHQIGEILAKLHLHASQWQIPEGFKRPKRDIGYFQGVLRGIQPALKNDRISPSDYSEFETSIALLTEMLRSLDEDRHTHGIMHADTHKGNMLYHDGEIQLIDFSFCAFGNFMFDLGICCSDMKESLHRAFLEGYQSLRTLPDDHQRLIEGFFVGSMVGTFSYWVANPHMQELLVTKVPQIAGDYAAKFNRGEHFWFS